MANGLPTTHAALDEFAEENDYEFPEDATTVAEKQQALVDAGFFEAPEPDEEEELVESTEPHKPRLILDGTWVRLGDTENVPEEFRGHEACVTVAPMKYSDGDELIPYRHQYQEEDTEFTVRTRDEYSATITGLTRDDFAIISDKGRIGLGSAG